MVFLGIGASLGMSVGGALYCAKVKQSQSDNKEMRDLVIGSSAALGLVLDIIAGIAFMTVGLLGLYHVIPLAGAGYWSMIGLGTACLALPGSVVAVVTIFGLCMVGCGLPIAACAKGIDLCANRNQGGATWS